MPRDLRHEVVNAIYHVTQHATGDEALFRDAFDRYFFERLLDRTLTIYGLDLIAYCQLDNHYHLLLRLRKATLAAGMQFLNGAAMCRDSMSDTIAVGHSSAVVTRRRSSRQRITT